jgi:hypothetical protein
MREISEQEYQEISDTFSIKSEYQKLSGKDVTPERFLFCCYEVSKHLKEVDINFKNSNLWPDFEQGDFSSSDIDDNIKKLCSWYGENQGNLKESKPVDFDSMWHICVELAHLEKDFSDLVKISTGEVIEDHLLDEAELEGVWKTFKEALHASIPSIAEKAWRYYMWAYGITPPKEEINLSEVPPVGRFARRDGGKPRTGGRDGGRGGRDNNRGGRGGRDNNRGGRNDRSARSNDRGDRKGGRNGRDRNRSHDKKRQAGHDKAKEQEVVGLVGEAISSLTGGKESVVLGPQNSFFRRIQHQHANDQGFTTESVGEGKERAVKIFSK